MAGDALRGVTGSCVVQGLVNYGPWAESDRPLVFTNRVLLECSRLVCLRVVDGHSRAAVEDVSSCRRDSMACSLKHLLSVREGLLVPGIGSRRHYFLSPPWHSVLGMRRFVPVGCPQCSGDSGV